MTSERTSPPSGPVASQLKYLSAAESASLPAARAERVAAPDEASRMDRSTSAGVNLWSKRFFIFSTTVFKFYELRGGGPAGNRAAIILIDCDFAKPGGRAPGHV